MKGKRSTYLLIIGLLAIWGFIAIKLIFNFDTTENVSNNNFVVEKAIIKNEIDSFSILANYEDPFRVKFYKKPIYSKKPKSAKTPSKPQAKKVAKPIKKITIEHIKYYGIIKNSNTSKAVGIVYINDQEVLVSVGSEIKEGKILSIQEDKLKLLYKEQAFELEKE